MEIKYLTSVRDYPVVISSGFKNKPLSIEKITNLEDKYNEGRLFPVALRELLYLAGKSCIFLDYGNNDSQEQMQEVIKRALVRENKLIAYPYFVIEVRDYDELAIIVPLDSGDDPTVREITTYPTDELWDRSCELSLSQFCNTSIEDIKMKINLYNS